MLENGAGVGASPVMQLEPFRILVVDDNPADRLLYRMSLSGNADWVFEIAEAENGEAALAVCRACRPDCIVLDFNLPSMDGLEFMSAVKREFGDLPCPIVMLTGVRDERIAVRAMKSGAADYIPKSDNVGDALERAIVGAIEKSRMRRQIQEQRTALAASERQHRSLLEALPQLVWVADTEGIVEYANRRWWEYTGLEPKNGIRMKDAVHAEDRQRYSDARKRAVATNSPFEMEVRLRRAADRSDRWHLIRVVAIKESGDNGKWLGTCTDIEDLKRAERAIQQKQKWESIGLLAGGIAHDFNNLLVGILGGASYAADVLPPNHSIQPTLDNIVKSGERAAKLTRQMLAYSGQGNFFLEQVDLSAAVKETFQLVRALIPPNVRLDINTADELPLIETDASQMQQVIMNLVVNAAEAIPENQPGTVNVWTSAEKISPTSAPPGFALPHDVLGGTFVILEVHDTGCGMDEETKSKIFDPFFTTKFTGRGLGLAAVQGILRSTGGWITVESARGQGSLFRVVIPAAHARVIAEPVEPVKETPVRQADGDTVLIVDDEEVVRQVTQIALQRAGYQVLAAADGATGLSMLEEHKDAISLVLLDMGMPEMSGKEVLTRIRASGSKVPVIICSGYSEPEVLRQFANCDFTAVIQKPFKAKELPERVARALKGAEKPGSAGGLAAGSLDVG
jgi:two-component system, cell cycle sensor histidine kinase and response regulator CckA